MIYLDSAATTQLDPEVIEIMIDYLKTQYGNPASKYYPQALSAQHYLAESRTKVAELINASSEFILFTSGASESNSFILKGVADKLQYKGKHIITSKIEHKSVLETCKYLESKGYEVTYLDVTPEGFYDMTQLESSFKDDTILVSLMWVNNEIGTVNDIKLITEICHSKGVLLHTDATQAVGKMTIDLEDVPVDFMSFSAHKLYGPKGIGAAYIGPDELGIRHKLTPLIHGGSQEFKMRGGTHAMHDIVGFGKACEVAKRDIDKYLPQIVQQERIFKDVLISYRRDITFNGNQIKKIPGLISIRVPGINNELFCKQISDQFAISTGSACTINEGSQVMQVLNVEKPDYLRISFCKFNTSEEQLMRLAYLLKNKD